MAEYILETKDLGISFGGLQAAQDVNIRIKKNQIYGKAIVKYSPLNEFDILIGSHKG